VLRISPKSDKSVYVLPRENATRSAELSESAPSIRPPIEPTPRIAILIATPQQPPTGHLAAKLIVT